MTDVVAPIHGRRLDARYTLIEKLGAGGQGEVWRAHDETRGVDIALKILAPAVARAEGMWAAFEHEYAIANRLDHPAILKIFPPQRSGEVVVLPMELATGGDLRRLRGAGYLEIIPVLLDIAQALEHAHERGVIHRDLKPGNVLFDARGRVRLADFGAASTTSTAAADSRLQGLSPFTASPEQLRGEPPTPGDDIYGLGALAYELLSGYPPYYPHFDIRRAQEEPVPSLVPTRQIPPLLTLLVTRMLEKDPRERPRSMREVIDELDAALNDTLTFEFETVAEPGSPGVEAGAAPEPVPPPQLRTPAMQAAILAGKTVAFSAANTVEPEEGFDNAAEDPPAREPDGSGRRTEAPRPAAPAIQQRSAAVLQAAAAASRAAAAANFAAPTATPARTTVPPAQTAAPGASAPRPSTQRPESTSFAAPAHAPPGHAPQVPQFMRSAQATKALQAAQATRAAPTHAAPAAPASSDSAPGEPFYFRQSATPTPVGQTGALADPLPAPGRGSSAGGSSEPRAIDIGVFPDLPAEGPTPQQRSQASKPPPQLHVQPAQQRQPFIQPQAQRAPLHAAGLAGSPGPSISSDRPLWEDLKLEAVPRPTRLEPMPTRRRWPIVLLGVLAGAAVGVFYLLPRYAPQTLPIDLSAISRATKSLAPSLPAIVSAPAAVTAAASTDAAPEAKLQAARENFDRRMAALEARGAGVWGGADFATAKTRAAESVGAHDAGNIRMAEERLADAAHLLDQVDSRAPQALAAQLAVGQKALATGQAEVANQAFDLARRIDPNDRRIADGQRHTRNLTGVLPLLADGQNAETARNYSRAAQDYSQALSLDPGNDKARAGLARANAAFGDDNYAKSIGSGYAALGAGRLDDARDAFEKARALRPGGSEAAQGLRRVGAALSAKGFASLRQRAAGLEAQERWDEAVQAYNSALQSDPSLLFAQEGKNRAAARADLEASLQALIDHPERLASQSARDQARGLLQTANEQSPSGPVLRSQIARLGLLLPQDFGKPVRLSLVSDNATAVAIPSIGQFGTFAKRDIELKPGHYTVIGTRDGFREVRRDITIAPGQESQTISVSCSDPI